MPSSNSVPQSRSTLPEVIPSVIPNNPSHLMPRGGYISSVITNQSRSALLPLPVNMQGVPTPGYYQVRNPTMPNPSFFWAGNNLPATEAPRTLSPSTLFYVQNPQINTSIVHNFSTPFARNFSTPFAYERNERAISPFVPAPFLAPFPCLPAQPHPLAEPRMRVPASPVVSGIQPVHGSYGLNRGVGRLLPRTYDCWECSASFDTPQGLGGHRGWHTRQKRRLEVDDASSSKKCKRDE